MKTSCDPLKFKHAWIELVQTITISRQRANFALIFAPEILPCPMIQRLLICFLITTVLLATGCQRKTPASTPESTPTSVTVVEEDLLIHNSSDPVGPQPAPEFAPIRYVDFPTKSNRDMSMINRLPPATNSCEFVGEVWDFANLDGCGYLLETTEGHIFRVSGLPQGYFLENGARIRFGFRYDEGDAVNDCPHQDAVIRITCMQGLRSSSGFERPFVCESFDKPSEWIQELILDLGATYVTRFPWDGDRVVYLFESPGGQFLYDCQGFVLCQPKQNCLKFIDDFSLGKQIYGDE